MEPRGAHFGPGNPPRYISVPGPGSWQQRKSELEMQRHRFASMSKETLSLCLSPSLRFVVCKIGIMTSSLSSPIELLVKLDEGEYGTTLNMEKLILQAYPHSAQIPFIRTGRDRAKKEKYRCLESTAVGFPVFCNRSKTTGRMKHLDQSPLWTGEKTRAQRERLNALWSQGETEVKPRS